MSRFSQFHAISHVDILGKVFIALILTAMQIFENGHFVVIP